MSALAVITTILRLLLEPQLANDVGAHAAGHPEYAPEIFRICRRESWGCRRIGVHVGHVARLPPSVFVAAGPRGPHGHVPGHALKHLPRCTPPAALDVPLVSAYVAARRLEELASRYRRRSPAARAHAWRHGVRCRCAEFERAAGAG